MKTTDEPDSANTPETKGGLRARLPALLRGDLVSSGEAASPASGEEYAAQPVPAERQVHWPAVAIISAMVAFSLPTFITGAEVFLASSNDDAIVAVVTGCLALALIASISGAIGAATHLSSYMLTRIAFGNRGAAFVNLAFAVSLLGWFGVNIDLFGGALQRLLGEGLGLHPPLWLIELGAGAAMTATTIYGFRAINLLSTLLVPVMMVTTALLLAAALDLRDLSASFAVQQASTLSLGDAISSVIGGMIVGAVILPDVTRFLRDWRGAVYTALLSYVAVQTLVMTVGGLAADALGNDDFLDVMLVLGMSAAAFVIVIAGSWVLNSLNLYSATLSVEATTQRLPNTPLIVLLGALGTVAAFFNILDAFLTFLFYLAIVFVPVAGVIAVDYLFVRRDAYGRLDSIDSMRASALGAWLLGSAIALLGAEGVISGSGIAALDAMLAAALGYFLLARLGPST
ncbi:MAG: cytosine permease [Pseudomonadota bacterium]